MGLNRVQGELIGDLGREYVVAPVTRWKDTILFADAAEHAAAAFRQTGSLAINSFSDEEVLIQEYPTKRKLAFLFCRKIRGQAHYYPFIFDLPDEMIADLRNVGRWGHLH